MPCASGSGLRDEPRYALGLFDHGVMPASHLCMVQEGSVARRSYICVCGPRFGPSDVSPN